MRGVSVEAAGSPEGGNDGYRNPAAIRIITQAQIEPMAGDHAVDRELSVFRPVDFRSALSLVMAALIALAHETITKGNVNHNSRSGIEIEKAGLSKIVLGMDSHVRGAARKDNEQQRIGVNRG
ncbi:hypothetical protein RBI21_01905 [Klebsiella pneumoniae]|nr:hypothetical protein RBI21_01905 [Klebsiella pneumoniae]